MIKLENVSKVFDKRGIAGLHKITCDFDGSKLFAVMGPSGSGKTTLLKVISGELTLDSGLITGNDQVAYLDSTIQLDRSLTMQQALFNSIHVTETDDQKVQLIRDISMQLEMTNKLKTLVSDLSAGQYQRLILATFLINRPTVLLLDEPFSNLDESLRAELMFQIKDLIQQREIMGIWVTHQTEEALRFADQILLLHHGHIEQSGTPQEVYFHPRSIFSAHFFGHTNLFTIIPKDKKWITPWGEQEFETSRSDSEILLIIPQESILLNEGINLGTIKALQFLGGSTLVEIDSSGQSLMAKIPSSKSSKFHKDQEISFNIKWLECLTVDCL